MKKKKYNEWLQDVIGDIDDELLLETEELRNRKLEKQFVQEILSQQLNKEQIVGLQSNKKAKKRKNIWKTIGTMVAGVSIFFISSFCWKIGLFGNYTKDIAQNGMYTTEQVELEQWHNEEKDFENSQQNQSNNLVEQNMKDISDITDKNQQSDSMGQSDFPQQTQIIENEIQGNTGEKRGEESEINSLSEQNVNTSAPTVYIPQKEVSLGKIEGQAPCMIPFFIYEDRVYVHYNNEVEHTKRLVGTYLGTATGLIDAWTKKDGYVNFAGSVKGDFYEVNGYEQEFMLCMPLENGDTWLFINDNDLLLQKGADIFEKYLHLSEKSYEAFYMTNKVWNNEKTYEEKKIPVNTKDYEKIENLLNAVNEGSVVLTKDVWKDCGINAFYDEKQLYHLYLEMEDGICIHLRIFEGGYVMFDGVSDVCVKIKR